MSADTCLCGCSWQLHVPHGRGETRGSCTSCTSCTRYEAAAHG